MGIPNSEVLALIAANTALIGQNGPEHDLVLDPLGVASGNVFTDYGLCIAAAAALSGFVRISVLSDVAVSAGSFGAEMSRITLAGGIASGAVPIITYDGTATHSSLPRALDLIQLNVGASATVVPFLPVDDLLSVVTTRVTSLTTETGSGPLIRYTGTVGLLLLIGDSITCGPDSASDPIFDFAIAGAGLQYVDVPTTLGTGSDIPDESWAAVAGATFDIFAGSPANNGTIAHPRDGSAVNASATVNYTSLGRNNVGFQISTTTETHRRLNTKWRLTTAGGAYTITLDLSETSIGDDNFMEFTTDRVNEENPVTLTLVGGSTFFDGSTSKVLQHPRGYWYMAERSDGLWDLKGPDGLESSDRGPLFARPSITTTDATPTDLHLRLLSTDEDVTGVEAIITGWDGSNNEMYKYKLSGIGKNNAGTVTVASTLEVIVEDDATATVALVTNATSNMRVQITGVVAKTIIWRSEIRYLEATV